MGSDPPNAMTSPQPSPLPAHRARELLRKLRDLNLSSARIAVNSRLSVTLAGCSSLDLPAESELRYRIQSSLCPNEELCVRLAPAGLVLERRGDGPEPVSRREVSLLGGASGPATAPELRARMDPDTTCPRETERFLRRLVRAVFPS